MPNQLCGIYKITSPSNKVYIGQSVHIERRKKVYEKGGKENQVRLFRSLQKYGFEKHKFEIIELCEMELLNERERHYQELYDVLGKNGLNCLLTQTNEKKKVRSEETKLKISNSHKGLKPDEATRKKMSEAAKNRNNKPFKGKKHSEETKLKIAASKKGKSVMTDELRKKYSEGAKLFWLNRKNLNNVFLKPA